MNVTDFLSILPAWPETNPSSLGKVQTKELSKSQKLIGASLGRNWVMIPHVTHQDEADVTDLEERRQLHNAQGGAKLTLVPLLVKALADALVAHPHFNVSLDHAPGRLTLKSYVHIGVAVDTPNGLLVPVIRDCDQKSEMEIAEEIVIQSEKARKKGLSFEEMSGGCITLTSLGHIGGTAFTPIINAPEAAILGAARIRTVAMRGPEGEVLWRQHLPLSLSYDHRVVNGADAARFARFVAERLAELLPVD